MMIIDYYEILSRELTKAIGFACNSRKYPIQNLIDEVEKLEYVLEEEQKTLTIFCDGEETLQYLEVPSEYFEYINTRKKVILMSAEPSAHPEDEAPEFEIIKIADKKL